MKPGCWVVAMFRSVAGLQRGCWLDILAVAGLLVVAHLAVAGHCNFVGNVPVCDAIGAVSLVLSLLCLSMYLHCK
jgi:hypothetical protein